LRNSVKTKAYLSVPLPTMEFLQNVEKEGRGCFKINEESIEPKVQPKND